MPRRDDRDDEYDDRPRRRRRRPAPGVPVGVWVGLGLGLFAVVVLGVVVVAAGGRRTGPTPDPAGPPLGLPGLVAEAVAGPADPDAFPPAEEAVWKRLVGEWATGPAGTTRRVLRFNPDRTLTRGSSVEGPTFSGGRTYTCRVAGITAADRGRFTVRLSLATVPGRPDLPEEVGRFRFDGDALVHEDDRTREEARYTREAVAAPSATR